MTTAEELFRQSEELYERFAKPLEPDHWGEYLAVSADGEVILGDDLEDLSLLAAMRLGEGVFVFKVGERAVGRWR